MRVKEVDKVLWWMSETKAKMVVMKAHARHTKVCISNGTKAGWQ